MEKSKLKVMALAIVMVLFSAAGAFAQSGNLLTNGDASKSTTGWARPPPQASRKLVQSPVPC